jgi:two-component system, NtrC family, sensor histidine kinase KinB
MKAIRPRQLRTRFLMAGLLFVVTTVASGLWSAYTFARMSSEVSETLQQSQEKIDVTAVLSQELEREDDALLLALSGDVKRARIELSSHRAIFDNSFQRLLDLIGTEPERLAAESLRRNADEYRSVGDALFDISTADKLGTYHATVNPILRRAVSDAADLRELTFRSMQAVGVQAGDQARQALGIVILVSVIALVVSTLTALQLARSVVRPISTLTESVDALRRGEFDRRVPVDTSDELGSLASGFNNMAHALDEFRRSNLGETLRAKETLESTLAALPNAVIVVDSSGKLVALNSAARAVLNAAGRHDAARMEELPLSSEHLKLIGNALAGKRSPANRADYSRSIPLSFNGKTVKLLPTAVPIPQFSGDRFGAVLVLDDVTDFVRLDELRTELIALVSHELRTPLTSLRMNILMLREDAGAFHERQRDILDAAIAGCEDLSRTIDELLDLSRVESGQLRLMKERIDLNGLFAQVLTSFRPRFVGAGVDLEGSSQCRQAIVLADGPRLAVVLSNLLSNALKYTPSGGRVQVRMSMQNAASTGRIYLQVAVSDTGSGVPEEFRERIFDKFFRIEHQNGKTAAAVQGAGFGLYLCRQIIEAHEGKIHCTGGGDRTGTTIAFEIPVDMQAGLIPERNVDTPLPQR